VKKYLFVLRASLRRMVEYRSEIVMDTFGKIVLPIGVQLILWKAIIVSNSTQHIAGYSFSDLMQYVVIAILISNFTRVERVEREISGSIREGGLNKFLAQPVDFMLYYFFVYLGDSMPSVVGGTLVYGALCATGVVSVSVAAMLCGLLIILLAAFISYMFSFLLAALAFWMDEVWTLFVMKNLLLWFLTGQLIPLDMFPPAAQRVMSYLPFGYLSYFPTKVLTGRLTFDEIGFGLSVTLAWSAVLYTAYKLFWNYALRRYSAFGG
jgi:ABC-2 type transport system permease protein